MKLSKILFSVSLIASSVFASEFLTYEKLSKVLKEEAKKSGNYATTKEVKKALSEKNLAGVDVRTAEEWGAGIIKGNKRV